MPKTIEVCIAGAGPAGIAAAIQLKRYGISPVLLEKDTVGGLLINANLVENYPGFPGGLTGKQLVRKFRKHLEVSGIEVIKETLLGIDFEGGNFSLRTDQNNYSSRLVVLATGTKPKKIRLAGLDQVLGKYAFHEVYPIMKVKNKRIAIIGAGDAAFDYALNLGRHNEVSINNRGRKFSCLPLLYERTQISPNIKYRTNYNLTELSVKNEELGLKWESGGGKSEEVVHFLLIAVGRVPGMGYLDSLEESQLSELRSKGLLYMIGDLANGRFRQASIAAGEGIKTAMLVYEKLKEFGE
ncbi:MAG: NAD(P)/FAD-dependent oxidoreductase [Candidatus Electryonea clarkiae]|nr:NAD(P)/FAD-dependent oxidoreductase [Candidatus Electryonea clarkiae]MDP8285043.1 NAD(P)/FAD-dependent oxidoreductase [Candidatus Electryonea clarkiae]